MPKYDSQKYWGKVKSRISHNCNECGGVIQKGGHYYKEKTDVHSPSQTLGELCVNCYESSITTRQERRSVDTKQDKEYKFRIIFGDSQDMRELPNRSVHLVVTSPPYFNAPFDYPGLFKDYSHFLQVMRNVAKELRRVLDEGRIAALVTDDTLIKGRKFPVVADITKVFVDEGFRYRDRIVWVKPEGYIRISRRSGVILQNPYPMYYYPDNLQESILIFQNGDFNYKRIDSSVREQSKIDLSRYQKEKWYLSVWYITNVLPIKNRLEQGIAAFPPEIPYRLINLFSYTGETVLDPFAGSGTTLKVAGNLGRNAVGYEIDAELLETMKEKLQLSQYALFDTELVSHQIIVREDSLHLRSLLQSRVSDSRPKAVK